MNGSGERMKAANESRGRGIEVFVANAADALGADCRGLFPSTLCDDSLKRHAVSSAAPCSDQYFGRCCFHFIE